MLKAENVFFRYGGGKLILDSINLTIEKGSFVSVLGQNGSGKSTLAKHFNALLTPTDGRVTVDGICTEEDGRIYDIRRKCGMVFQNPDNQLVAATAEEDVAFAPENLGVPSEEIKKTVSACLAAVGMPDMAERETASLSGGQKQRLAIAGILAMRPEYIVLDEPTAMLDPSGRQEVLKTIRKLNRDRGMTVVLITHYMEEAALSDRVVVTDGGKIVLDGTPREVFSHVCELKKLGLDVPQVTELLYSLKLDGYDVNFDIIDEDKAAREILRLLQGDNHNDTC